MIATVAYFVAAVYGAQIPVYALGFTAVVDIAASKAFRDWMDSRAMVRAKYVPVMVEPDEENMEEVEDMALSADEVEDHFEQGQ